MDAIDLEKNYMEDYNKLARAYAESGIRCTVESMNRAIRTEDREKAGECLPEIQRWNTRVTGLEATRMSLNSCFRHLRLPSAGIFTILYDGTIRQWKFNTGPAGTGR